MDRHKPEVEVQDTSIVECRAKSTCPSSSVDKWEEHPLFMTAVPSPEAFRRNPLLCALAATIDETEQLPFGPRRRRRNNESARTQDNDNRVQSARRRNIPIGPYTLRKEVASKGCPQRDTTAPCDFKNEANAHVAEADSDRSTANADDSGPSMGELHICMHMWSIGNK